MKCPIEILAPVTGAAWERDEGLGAWMAPGAVTTSPPCALEPSTGKESTWGALTQTGRLTLAISKARVYQSGLPLLQMTEHWLERASAEKDWTHLRFPCHQGNRGARLELREAGTGTGTPQDSLSVAHVHVPLSVCSVSC